MNASPGAGADLYAVLGVDRHADEATINASYRRLAKLKHPDKNRTNPAATAEFQDLNKAYSILRDARQRRAYDQAHPPPGPRARGPPVTPPAEPAGVHPQSAARAAAATAAENAKTPAQRRAEADAALQANAARYGGGTPTSSTRARRRPAFRFVRMPTTWDGAAGGGGGGEDHPQDTLFEDDPACKALQDEINALRRAMQQRDAADAALHRQQKQLALQMDAAWAAVGQHSAALRQLDAQRAQRQATDDWFEGLFGQGTRETSQTSQRAAAAEAERHRAEADRLRADLDRAQRTLAATRAKTHAVVAQLAASAAQRHDQDAQLKALAARYRAAAFKSGGAGVDDNAHFDGWVAWEEPEVEAGHGTRNLWQEDDDNDGGGGGLWDSGSEAGTAVRGDAGVDGNGDHNPDPWAPDTDRQRRQWFPFDATAAEWVPQQQRTTVGDEANTPTYTAPAAEGHSDGGTNVWDDGSSEERFNADLLHIESDEEEPVSADEGEESEEEEEEEEEEEDDEDDDDVDGDDGEDKDIDDEEAEEEAEDEVDDDDDDYEATVWYLDEDLSEAYTQQLKLDENSWHAEVCREW